MSFEIDGRKLAELRVVDLREELERRGLDKSGNKQVLLERLQKALESANKLDDVKIDAGEIKEEAENQNGTKEDDDETEDIDKSNEENAEKAVNNEVIEIKSDDDSFTSKQTTDTVNESIDLSASNVESTATEALPDNEDKQPKDTKNSPTTVRQEEPKETSDAEIKSEEKQCYAKPEEAKPDHKEKDTPAEKSPPQESPDKTLKNEDVPKEDTKSEENQGESTTKAKESTSEDKPRSDKSEATIEEKKLEEVKNDIADNTTKSTPNNSTGTGTGTANAKTTPRTTKGKLTNDQNRSLWITNISQKTRATELKQALSEHGKVVGAKVVINAKHPAACCYGYVKMETVEDAENCIAKLNNTELNGQIIRIEKVRPDHLNPVKSKIDNKEKEKQASKVPVTMSPSTQTAKQPETDDKKDKKDDKTKDVKKEKDEKNEKILEKKDKLGLDERRLSDGGKARSQRSRSRQRRSRERKRSTSRSRTERSLSARSGPRGRDRERDMLTFDKIKDERERERMRERERILRDRRREEAARQREIERQQRSEAVRLEREREKLRRERENLERERAEFMQLERERQKLERKKLEQERLELERAKMRVQEEERRAVKRTANYRERERSYEDRKRVATDRHFDEAPPPPRFDAPASIKARDTSPALKKFSSTTSSSNKDYTKSRVNYDKRDSGGYPSKRDYDDRSHPSVSRGGPPVPKYDNNSSSYSSRDRTDIRGSGDPRVRETSNMAVSGSSKYNSSDSKVRYNERERERSPPFRSMRDERDRRPIADGKSDVRSSRDHRYPEHSKESVRYERSSTSSGTNWSQQKSFNNVGAVNNKQWSKDGWRTDNQTTAERWSANNPPRTTLPSGFPNSAGMNMGTNCPPPPGINNYVNDRFDYKANMGSMRKY